MAELTQFDPATLATADDVTAAAERIFGREPTPRGLLHVCAVAHRADGMLVTLAVGSDARRPPEDRFVLALGRARADAIVITGAVLRAEPALRHAPDLADPMTAALEAWRHRSGDKRPFTTVIMTRSRDLDLDHPLFGDRRPVIIFTGEDAPPRFGIELARRGVIVMTDPEPSLHSCLRRLEHAGFTAVTVEAGPTVARQLYEQPIAVHETLLTVLESDALPADATRGVLLPESILADRMRSVGCGYSTPSEAGTWRFERYVR